MGHPVDENVPHPSTPQILFEEPIISHNTTARLEVSRKSVSKRVYPIPALAQRHMKINAVPQPQVPNELGQKGRELSVDQLFLPQRLWPGVQPTQRRKRKCEAGTIARRPKSTLSEPRIMIQPNSRTGPTCATIKVAKPMASVKQAHTMGLQVHRLPDGGVTILSFREPPRESGQSVHDRCNGNHGDD